MQVKPARLSVAEVGAVKLLRSSLEIQTLTSSRSVVVGAVVVGVENGRGLSVKLIASGARPDVAVIVNIEHSPATGSGEDIA